MTLRRVRLIYAIAVASIAVILICTAEFIGLVTAVIILIGAVPMFRAVKRAAGNMMLTAVENRNRERAALKVPRAEESPGSDRREIPPATRQ